MANRQLVETGWGVMAICWGSFALGFVLAVPVL